jgi:hypothetical protein
VAGGWWRCLDMGSRRLETKKGYLLTTTKLVKSGRFLYKRA